MGIRLNECVVPMVFADENEAQQYELDAEELEQLAEDHCEWLDRVMYAGMDPRYAEAILEGLRNRTCDECPLAEYCKDDCPDAVIPAFEAGYFDEKDRQDYLVPVSASRLHEIIEALIISFDSCADCPLANSCEHHDGPNDKGYTRIGNTCREDLEDYLHIGNTLL